MWRLLFKEVCEENPTAGFKADSKKGRNAAVRRRECYKAILQENFLNLLL